MWSVTKYGMFCLALTAGCASGDNNKETRELGIAADQAPTPPDAAPDATLPDGIVRFDLQPRPDAAADGALDVAPADAALDAPPDLTIDAPPDVVADYLPSTYLVIITEMMVNPEGVDDTHGEWIELYNASMYPVDLDGWTIKDDDSDSYVISGSVSIASGAFLLLGVDDQQATNGGVTVAHAVSNFSLDNSSDEVVLLDQDGKLADRVVYDPSWSVPAGASMQLRDISLDNSFATSWCAAVSDWGGAGDLGTPGASNACTVPDAGVDAAVDAGPPDAAPPDASPDLAPDVGPGPPTCPPQGASPTNPAYGLGDFAGQSCDYACWGNGTIYNVCATGMWQFCLPDGTFAPCQVKP